jgi:hypothetical protein
LGLAISAWFSASWGRWLSLQVIQYARDIVPTSARVDTSPDCFRRASRDCWNIFNRLSRCSWKGQPIMITSSKYRRHELHMRPRRTVSISLSNVARALQKLKGMTVNCHNPWPVNNAVFSLLSRCTSTCQFLLFRSRVQNHLAPASV